MLHVLFQSDYTFINSDLFVHIGLILCFHQEPNKKNVIAVTKQPYLRIARPVWWPHWYTSPDMDVSLCFFEIFCYELNALELK